MSDLRPLPEQKHASGQIEAEINEIACPPDQTIIPYNEESRRIDEEIQHFEQQIKKIDRQAWDDEVEAEETLAEIAELEERAKEAARTFNKEVEEHRKTQLKEQHELQEQELKTIELAEKLAQHQAQAKEMELEQVRQAMNTEYQARFLAEKLVHEREQECKVAEQRMHKLLHLEEEMKNRVHELGESEAEDRCELEIKQKEINAKIRLARHRLEELKLRYEIDKDDFEEKEVRLEKIRYQAKMIQELAEKHNGEHMQLEQYIRELDQKNERERETNNQLLDEYEQLKKEIDAQREQLAHEEIEIMQCESILSKRQEARKIIESYGKAKLQDEELAHQKAKELAHKIEEERRQTQAEVAHLVGDEQDARKLAAELGKHINIKIEEKPKSVDAFQLTHYETTEPVVSEMRIDEHEDKSLGSKIIDSVKGLF